MSSEKTPKLNLHKWTPTDYVDMAEFNDNFGKIDTEIGNVATQLAETATNIAHVESFKIQTPEVDDTGRIQRAIDSLTSGGKLVIAKKYKITTINLKSNITIEGVGQEVSGFISTSDIAINVPNGSVRWSLSNFGIWGNIDTTTAIKLAGGSGGIADFSVRDVYIKSCLVGLDTYFAWSFVFDRVRFQDCRTALVFASQTNQGIFIACSFKVTKKVLDFKNCSSINFIGCEFAGNNHDGTIPFSFFQSSAVTFNGNYIEYFAENTTLFAIGTIAGLGCTGISITSNYISHASTGAFANIYRINGLQIKNNYFRGTIAHLINDELGVSTDIDISSNEGYVIESSLVNFIPNHNFFAWNGNAPYDFALMGGATSKRGADGSFEITTTTGLTGFFVAVNQLDLKYITFGIDVKSSVDNIMYIDFYKDNSIYGSTKSINIKANTDTKISIIPYMDAFRITYCRVRFSLSGTHNVGAIKAYRGIVNVDEDKSPLKISSAKPTHGTYYKGDVVVNNNAVAGSYEKWKCVVGDGTVLGTWKGVGLIEV